MRDYTEDRKLQMATGADKGGGAASFNTSFQDISTGIFGEDAETAGTKTTDATVTESIAVDEAGILKMIEDVLGGQQGLAAIFGGEQAVGLSGGSVAKQGTEDLLAKIAGEIAKVTATKTQTTTGTETTTGTAKSEGLADQLGLGGVDPADTLFPGLNKGAGELKDADVVTGGLF